MGDKNFRVQTEYNSNDSSLQLSSSCEMIPRLYRIAWRCKARLVMLRASRDAVRGQRRQFRHSSPKLTKPVLTPIYATKRTGHFNAPRLFFHHTTAGYYIVRRPEDAGPVDH